MIARGDSGEHKPLLDKGGNKRNNDGGGYERRGRGGHRGGRDNYNRDDRNHGDRGGHRGGRGGHNSRGGFETRQPGEVGHNNSDSWGTGGNDAEARKAVNDLRNQMDRAAERNMEEAKRGKNDIQKVRLNLN